jgi:ADP-ribose pyrophosphatase YjhB (NUDIX family)
VPSWYRDPDAPAPNRPRKVGVCFIVELPDGVLIDTRLDGEEAFTGGTLDEGEGVLDCLGRELREETGLEATDTRFLGVFSDPTRLLGYQDGSVYPLVTLAFVVTPGPGDPLPSEESRGFCIVPKEQLRDLELTAVHHPIRDAYLGFGGRPVIA